MLLPQRPFHCNWGLRELRFQFRSGDQVHNSPLLHSCKSSSQFYAVVVMNAAAFSAAGLTLATIETSRDVFPGSLGGSGASSLRKGGWREHTKVQGITVCKKGEAIPEAGTRQRAKKQELKRQAVNTYRSRFIQALQDELCEEMQVMKERLETWPKRRLQDEGLALFDLSVSSAGNLYRERILRFFSARGDGFLPLHHQFTQGDVVAISQNSPMEDDVIEGVVMERARRFLRVTVTATQARLIKVHPRWRLDLSANRVSFERCVSAVDLFSSTSIRQGSVESIRVQIPANLSPGITRGLTVDESLILGEGLLAIRNVILSSEAALLKVDSQAVLGHQYEDCHAEVNKLALEALTVATSPCSCVRGKKLSAFSSLLKTVLNNLNTDLNQSQEAALLAGMSQRVTLWQGPPGTGKTKTLVQFIRAFCRSGQGKVLACADSNVAVDNMVEGLLEHGLNVLRVGQPVKVKEELREATIEAQIAAHPKMQKARQLRQESAMQRETARQINNKEKRILNAKEATSTWEKAIALEAEATKAVLDKAEVVASTCVGAGDPVLDGYKFHACVIDEATQATEPVSLIPLLKSGADRVVLVGDPAQLPPTVVSQDALKAGLAVSLFERLQACGLKPLLLNTQYRMHPAIARLPSIMFYGGQLLSNPTPSERPAPKGYQWPNPNQPLVFVDCPDGKEETTLTGNSWSNRLEALQVVKTVALLLSGGDIDGGPLGVGVIAPYSAQVRLLQDLLMAADGDNKDKYVGLEVKTVDGFQGREKEVIVLSTVRSNPQGKLGFLVDSRRMNVALTRARKGVVVIGNSNTLMSNPFWASWLKHMVRQKLVISGSHH